MKKIDLDFKKSTHSKHEQYGDGNCVEIKRMENKILIRDSKQQDGDILEFTKSEWSAFIAGVKDKEFDI